MKKNLRPKSRLKRKRKHGFRARMKTRSGRQIVNRKRRRKKKKLAP